MAGYVSRAESPHHFSHNYYSTCHLPSYISDQQSIKVIERTAVPVIKVSTKDARSRVVQLDLSFDAKEHHGMEALIMIQNILEVCEQWGNSCFTCIACGNILTPIEQSILQQMPVVRPLVLVLKQFLLDRGLLTAYTGGLSSYCLFLMVARYCQEQAPTWNDCGSLLMGWVIVTSCPKANNLDLWHSSNRSLLSHIFFLLLLLIRSSHHNCYHRLLDFYGNYFDPRITGAFLFYFSDPMLLLYFFLSHLHSFLLRHKCSN